MTQIFNKTAKKSLRRLLRKQQPRSEELLWRKLRSRQLAGFKFRRQYSIDRYVVDFYCSDAQLVVEIDGDSHFTPEAQKYDKIRESYFGSLGLTTIRFTNLEVKENLAGVLMVIQEATKKKQVPDR